MIRKGFGMVVLLFVSGLAYAVKQQEIRRSIYFGGGSYSIDGQQVLDLYHWLDSIPQLMEKYDILLISHTDPIGGKEFNEWLSKMRSEAVQKVLLDWQIPPHKISVKD